MDDSVKQAMAKWPNVPHCYGWLALDARGGWRMRDEAAQQSGQAGERITNQALLGFINRNYACDDDGRWYFQNGPQRVYVDLEDWSLSRTHYLAPIPPGGSATHTWLPAPDATMPRRACIRMGSPPRGTAALGMP